MDFRFTPAELIRIRRRSIIDSDPGVALAVSAMTVPGERPVIRNRCFEIQANDAYFFNRIGRLPTFKAGSEVRSGWFVMPYR